MNRNFDINEIQPRLQEELKTMLSYNKDGRRIKERSYIRKQRLLYLVNISMALNVLSDRKDLFDKNIVDEANDIIIKEMRRLWHR